MSPKLSLVPQEETCEGARRRDAQIIKLPVTPRLHAIEGGKNTAAETSNTSYGIDENSYTPYHRPNIGIGHHNAQRYWETEDTSGRKVDYIIGGARVETIDNHPMLAAETVIRRADGVQMVVQLTHNAFSELLKNRLRVPTDIPEDAY